MKKVRYFEQEEAFPVVAKAIEGFGARSNDYMPHDAVVDFLLQDPEGYRLISWASNRAKFERDSRSQDWTLKDWAANMVAWFSQKYTMRQLPLAWLDHFDRRKQQDGNYAYRVRRTA